MTKTFLLMKIELLNLFSSSNFARRKKAAKAVGLTMFLIPAGVMLYISLVYSLLLIDTLPAESRFMMPALMTAMTVIMLIILSFYNAVGHLFGFRDFDFLMSLPVKRSDIMVSKLLAFLLMDYFFAFFLAIPYIIIYGVKTAQAVPYYLMGLIGFLFMPLIPMVLASVLALLLNKLIGNFKHRQLFRNIFTLILFGLVMVGSMQLEKLMFLDLSSAQAIMANFQRYAYPVYLFTKMLLESSWLSLLAFILLNTAVMALFVVLFNRMFIAINSHISRGYHVKDYKLRVGGVTSRLNAMFKLQVQRYFGSTILMINTIVGPLMLLIAVGVGAFSGIDEVKLTMILLAKEGLLMPFLIAGIAFTSSMCMVTASSISLEGKNIDALRALPLPTKEIFLSKILLQVVITCVFSIPAIILGAVIFELSLGDAVILILATFFSSVFFALFGLITNIIFPKLDWESETVVVKQSLSVMIAIFGGMGIIALQGYGFYLLSDSLSFTLFLLIIAVVDLLIMAGMWQYLLNGGSRRFRQL